MRVCVCISNYVSQSTCLMHLVTCMHPLQVVLLLCTLQYTTYSHGLGLRITHRNHSQKAAEKRAGHIQLSVKQCVCRHVVWVCICDCTVCANQNHSVIHQALAKCPAPWWPHFTSLLAFLVPSKKGRGCKRVCSFAWLYVTLCDPMDCSLLGSSVHVILQARILESVALSFSRGSSPPRDWTHVFCTGRQVLYHWAAREAPGRSYNLSVFTFEESEVPRSHLPKVTWPMRAPMCCL